MKGWILRFLCSALALFVITRVLPGVVVKDWPTLFVAVFVMGVVNAFIRPIVMLIALPINCLTFGLFGLVINAALFWLAGSVTPNFHVKSFVDALIGSLLMGALSGVFSWVAEDVVVRRR